MATRPTIPQSAPAEVSNLINGCAVYLRPIEVDLLAHLHAHPTQSFSARELAWRFVTTPDAVRTFVFNLRRALGKDVILSTPARGGRARGYRWGGGEKRRARAEADAAMERLLTEIEEGGRAEEVRAAARAFWDALDRASERTAA